LAIKPTNAKDPEDYLAQIDEPRRSDIEVLDKVIREAAQIFDKTPAFAIAT